jgi:hypothetical protein
MKIIPDYDANALAAPQSFRDGVQTAIDILDKTFIANITVKIAVGYGERDGNPLPDPNESKGGFSNGTTISYAQLRVDLAAFSDIDATSTSLPVASNVNGVSSFTISPAQERVFGLLPAVNSTSTDDGSIGMGTGFKGNVLVSGALHEIAHALGRDDGTSLDVFRFTNLGTRLFTGGGSSVPAYFSLDDGTTDTADFGQNSDPGDFLNPPSSTRTPNDPFNENVGNLGALTPIDREIMDALGFAVTPTPASRFDFNGDGTSDVLWRSTSGGLADWDMTGGSMGALVITYNGTPIGPDPSWNVAGIGDFNGDKNADILWRNVGGALVDWSMNGSAVMSGNFLTLNGQIIAPDATWSVAGTGDFNGNGRADILWRQSASGALAIWDMNGATINTSTAVTINSVAVRPDSSWSVAGVADFNGNGNADILWRNAATNEVSLWQMNGSNIASAADLTLAGQRVAPDASWSIAGVGDFNADGNADVLWRQGSTGALALWLMNGSTIGASVTPTFDGTPISPDQSWSIVQVSDFNGDGMSDILWRNTDGTLTEWMMDGGNIVQALTPKADGITVTPGNSWTTQAKPTNFA